MTLEQIKNKLQNDFTSITLSVEEIFIDYGANWLEDTIVVTHKDNSSYQALSPAQINKVAEGLGEEVYKELYDKMVQRGYSK